MGGTGQAVLDRAGQHWDALIHAGLDWAVLIRAGLWCSVLRWAVLGCAGRWTGADCSLLGQCCSLGTQPPRVPVPLDGADPVAGGQQGGAGAEVG